MESVIMDLGLDIGYEGIYGEDEFEGVDMFGDFSIDGIGNLPNATPTQNLPINARVVTQTVAPIIPKPDTKRETVTKRITAPTPEMVTKMTAGVKPKSMMTTPSISTNIFGRPIPREAILLGGGLLLLAGVIMFAGSKKK